MNYYKSIKSEKNLFKAWQKVRSSGITSNSQEIKNDTKEYEENLYHNIKSISSKLSAKSFKFESAKGITLKRSGKSPRPIVIAPTENKIVQRAILNVLQDDEHIEKIINTENSFGGIKVKKNYEVKSKNVKSAIEKLKEYIDDGYCWVGKSDIKSFFTNIRKEYFMQEISKNINDIDFLNVLRDAIDIELSNLDELRKNIELFPIHEIGVAQGCCLSPLVGNFILYDFDIEFNKRNIHCIRYIDDFIIVGKNRKSVEKALFSAQKMLQAINLDSYTPEEDDNKSMIWYTSEKIEFLGIEIEKDKIRPSLKSKQKLLDKIDEIINKSIKSYKNPNQCYNNNYSFSKSIIKIDNILKGWVKQYSFCNDRDFLFKLGNQIYKRVEKYTEITNSFLKKIEKDSEKQQITGVLIFKNGDWNLQ